MKLFSIAAAKTMTLSYLWIGNHAGFTGLNRKHRGWLHGPGVVPHRNRMTTIPLQRKASHMNASAMPISDASLSEEAVAAWDGENINTEELIRKVKFNEAGLVPAIAQQWDTGEVLMMAWMNAESIRVTMRGGRAVYYSRSRKELWRKGDTSGQIQVMRDIFLDCDGDTVLLKVDQLGVACHTGRRSCFYTTFRPPSGEAKIVADVLLDPKELYKSE